MFLMIKLSTQLVSIVSSCINNNLQQYEIIVKSVRQKTILSFTKSNKTVYLLLLKKVIKFYYRLHFVSDDRMSTFV